MIDDSYETETETETKCVSKPFAADLISFVPFHHLSHQDPFGTAACLVGLTSPILVLPGNRKSVFTGSC